MVKISGAAASVAEIIRSKQLKTIAEVGVYNCHFAKQVLYACSDVIENYYMVDPYPHGYVGGSSMGVNWEDEKWDSLYRNACKFSINTKQAKVFRLYSAEASQLFTAHSLDLVYIDADHKQESVSDDIDHWLPKIRRGGIISGHDYGAGWAGVVEAVNEKFGKPNRGKKSVWWVEV